MYLLPIPAYVYKIKHIATGQYYYGFRKAHIKAKRTPEQDFFIYYYSSSKIVKSMINEFGVHQFEASIVYQNIDSSEAFWYEQNLIKESWGNHLMINKFYIDRVTSTGVFLNLGHSKNTKEKISKSKLGKSGFVQTEGSIKKQLDTKKSRNIKTMHTAEVVDKWKESRKRNNKKRTPEMNEKGINTKLQKYGTTSIRYEDTVSKMLETKKSKGNFRNAYNDEANAKRVATMRENGSIMSGSTPEAKTKRKETMMAKWGTTNPREICKLKKLLGTQK